MANIISLTFSNSVALSAEKYVYQNNTDDDIFNGINSDFGNVTLAYNASEFTTPSGPSPIDRPAGGFATINAAAESWKVQILNYYVVPYYMVINISSSSTGSPVDISVSARTGLNNSTDTFDKVLFDTVNTNETAVYTGKEVALEYRTLTDTFAVRVDTGRPNGEPSCSIFQLYIYGYIFRKDNTTLPPVKAATLLGDMKDSFTAVSEDTEGVLEHRNVLHVVPNTVFKTSTETLTGNITLDNTGESTVFIFDPNGADRDVVLPENPVLDQYIKIININGTNKLIVKEDTTVLVNLSNADITLVSELIFDGTEWIITNG